jgi:hypothetical protein
MIVVVLSARKNLPSNHTTYIIYMGDKNAK